MVWLFLTVAVLVIGLGFLLATWLLRLRRKRRPTVPPTGPDTFFGMALVINENIPPDKIYLLGGNTIVMSSSALSTIERAFDGRIQ